MRVRFTPLMGFLCLGCGAFMLFTVLVTGNATSGMLGLMQVALGLGWLTQPSVVVTDTEVEYRNLLGMTLRRAAFASFKSFAVEDSAVFVVDKDGERRKVIGRMLAHRLDYQTLVGEIQKRQSSAK